jgi:hypothetical protein
MASATFAFDPVEGEVELYYCIGSVVQPAGHVLQPVVEKGCSPFADIPDGKEMNP